MMGKYKLFCLLFFTAIVLPSCAHQPTMMTQAACESFNPYQQGVVDGREGKPFQFSTIRTQCAEYGVDLSVAEYSRGWQAGLRLRGFGDEY